MKSWITSFLRCGLLVLAISACHTVTSTPQTLESPLGASVSPSASPLNATKAPTPAIVPFELDRPLRAGATKITGSGPPNVVIVLQDVTFMGEFVGTDEIDENGRFSVGLAMLLEAGHRIGLTIDVDATTVPLGDLSSQGYRGPEGRVHSAGWLLLRYRDGAGLGAAPA